MISDRRMYNVKPGCEAAVVELLKEEIEGNTAYTHSYRIYTSNISSYDVVVVEWEFEDLQEMQADWDAWFAKTDMTEFNEKWDELTERGGHGEIWELVAMR